MIPMENSADKEIIISGGSGNMFTKVIGRQYSFYLSGEVKEPEEYIEWFDIIRNAGPDDDIVIHINSMGGNLDTALQFIRAISETQACVTTSIEGSCMSAATMIFLQGHSFQISPFSLFMVHNYSGGAFGKGGEMYDNIVYERNWSKDFLHTVYKDFLTEAEINSMLDNKDLWLTHKDVETRCRELMKKRIAKAKAAGADIPEDYSVE